MTTPRGPELNEKMGEVVSLDSRRATGSPSGQDVYYFAPFKYSDEPLDFEEEGKLCLITSPGERKGLLLEPEDALMLAHDIITAVNLHGILR